MRKCVLSSFVQRRHRRRTRESSHVPDSALSRCDLAHVHALEQGIALLAWPAEYGVSGVKSFMINHDGVVYEKDLGEETGTAVQSIQLFDPDSSWSIVEPEDAS